MQLIIRRVVTSKLFVWSGWVVAFIASLLWRFSHSHLKELYFNPTNLPASSISCNFSNAEHVSKSSSSRTSIRIIVPFMKSDPKHDVLGQPFMFLLDNFYSDLGSKLNMRIELLHVVDHMIYTQYHQNPDIAKQISILYGPSWLSYQKNIRIEFSLRNFFKHQPWDLLMFVDEFTAQFDYLIVLRSPYEFIDEENLEKIINSSFKCGCLSKHCDGSFVIPKSVLKEVWAHNRMKDVDVLEHRIGEYYHQNIIFYKELLSEKNVLTNELHEGRPKKMYEDFYNIEAGQINMTNIYQMHHLFQPLLELPNVYSQNGNYPAPNFLHIPKNLQHNHCRHSSNIMILVKSGRHSFSDRFQLRRILNSSPTLSNFAFLIGTSTGTNQNAQRDDNLLKMEINEYDDIILADFFDTYENLPLKTKSMYKFAADYCSKTIDYYFMIDSDVFLPANAPELIHEAQHFNRTADQSLQILCLRPSKGLHGTVYHGKYYKTIQMFPPSQMPAYCNGQATLLSRDAVEKIQAISETTNMNNFRIEDELFTGIFRHKAGIDSIGIYPDIVHAMLKEKPVRGSNDYQEKMRLRKDFLRNIIWHRTDQSWSQNWTVLDNQAMNFKPDFKLRRQSKTSVMKMADKARIKRQKAMLASKRHFHGNT